MSTGITALAYSISTASNSSNSPITLSHAQQLIAAYLGFNSLAAYQAAVKADKAPENFDLARHIVVDKERLEKRHLELKCGLNLGHLKLLIGNAFEEKLSDVHAHDDLDDYLEELFYELQSHVENHYSIVSEISLANHDGVKEVYFDYDLETIKESIRDRSEINVDGSVALNVDIERPYSGHTVNFEISLAMEIFGDRFFGITVFRVVHAKLDQNWSDEADSDFDDRENYEGPSRTLAEIYAELTGLDLEDAKLISDVEPQEDSGSSGDMTYGYNIDFSDIDFPEIKTKILKNKGKLKFEEGPNFLNGLNPFEELTL